MVSPAVRAFDELAASLQLNLTYMCLFEGLIQSLANLFMRDPSEQSAL